MKLKLVVASMSVLGLVSCQVLAASETKHKHHHQQHKQHVAHHEYKEYKEMAPACVITQNAITMMEMTQNLGRSIPNPCNPGWFNRIQLSGGVNVDIGKWGNRNTNYMGENYQRFSLNDAYLNVSANVNEWVNAFASISYNTATINANPSLYKVFGAAEYSAAYSNNINGSNVSAVQLEQAFFTIGNFDMSPIFLQVGKGFQDFSRYDIHPITRSLTQVMSETLATAVKLGFLAEGFNGDVYVFDDPVAKIGSGSAKTTNYGIALGYSAPCETLGWDIGAAYLYNLIGVNDTAYSVQNFTGGMGYHTRVGGVALYADVNSGPFSLGARYTTAVQRFSVLDLTKNGFADLTVASPLLGSGLQVVPFADASGAKPWTAGITGAYSFEAWCKNQNIYVGYQASREAAGLNIPKSRWLAGYGIEMWKNTDFGVEWDHDMAYNTSNGGSGNNTNLVSLRAAVKFG